MTKIGYVDFYVGEKPWFISSGRETLKEDSNTSVWVKKIIEYEKKICEVRNYLKR